MSLARVNSHKSSNTNHDENLASIKRLSWLKYSLQGQAPCQDTSKSTLPNSHVDLEAQEYDGYVRRAEPSAYWTGRFMTLNDRFWNDSEDIPKPGVKGGAQMMQSRDELRAKRVFDYLEKRCVTDSAQKSLWVRMSHAGIGKYVC